MLKDKKFIGLQVFTLAYIMFCILASLIFTGEITLHTNINLPMSMAWNIILALIAFDFSYFFVTSKNIIGQVIFGLIWLIFYPNTFYLLTDAKHFSDWFPADSVSNLSSIRTVVNFNILIFGIIFGVVLGAWSARLVLERFTKKITWKILITILLSFLGAIGIFVGRSASLRLNSWDLFTQPYQTFLLILRSISQENLPFILSFMLTQCAIILLFYLAVDFPKKARK
ncbi:DUF1361 domain-containing protein [Lactococcus nasutitermitis]|uniref:DUF1361 domain-containing protein n=1 Tax=Lactococcus nasutitermitis TaxID=1652957 RepID=A0ABV9JFJ2_9LACT|nr:DUF1361 domain-containing protein [Lactococcus nasutitermitis]